MNPSWTETKRHPNCSDPCVSDLALDQLFCDELPQADAQALRNQINACAGCQVRWEERGQGLKAFPELDAGALVAKIHVGLAQAEPAPEPREEGWLAWFFGAKWLGAAALATLAVVFVLPELETNDPAAPEILRAKGKEAAVSIYRERAGTVDLFESNSTARAGDRIQFELRGLDEGYVVIVGEEASGSRYNLLEAESVMPSLDAPYLVPKAFELDDSLGTETFVLYHCAPNTPRSSVFDGQAIEGCKRFETQIEKVKE